MKIEIEISELDQKILVANNVYIQEWLDGAVAGMINRQTKKLLKIAQQDLIEDEGVDNIPATVKGIVELWLSRGYMKNQENEGITAE